MNYDDLTSDSVYLVQLLQSKKVQFSDYNTTFISACQNKNVEIIEYIHDEVGIDILSIGFIELCKHNDIELLRYLHKIIYDKWQIKDFLVDYLQTDNYNLDILKFLFEVMSNESNNTCDIIEILLNVKSYHDEIFEIIDSLVINGDNMNDNMNDIYNFVSLFGKTQIVNSMKKKYSQLVLTESISTQQMFKEIIMSCNELFTEIFYSQITFINFIHVIDVMYNKNIEWIDPIFYAHDKTINKIFYDIIKNSSLDVIQQLDEYLNNKNSKKYCKYRLNLLVCAYILNNNIYIQWLRPLIDNTMKNSIIEYITGSDDIISYRYDEFIDNIDELNKYLKIHYPNNDNDLLLYKLFGRCKYYDISDDLIEDFVSNAPLKYIKFVIQFFVHTHYRKQICKNTDDVIKWYYNNFADDYEIPEIIKVLYNSNKLDLIKNILEDGFKNRDVIDRLYFLACKDKKLDLVQFLASKCDEYDYEIVKEYGSTLIIGTITTRYIRILNVLNNKKISINEQINKIKKIFRTNKIANTQINNEQCLICKEDIISPYIITCDNKHYYHVRCINEWMKNHNTCPLCSKNLTELDDCLIG